MKQDNNINELIHQPTRLKIMALLSSLEEEIFVDFKFLLDELSLTEGNLSIHLQKLEAAEFIQIKKEFLNKKPKTFINITKNGRAEFENYLNELESIIKRK
ncbi:MAG: hypothetical protein A2015_00760 [Spirochaetes bacterium GWF1_31_7]|nr:MAG: hypothetical protein A2Y30_12625 [Spirochaetes bacterium GWE1_32_154]OHD51653.1 MAG: hypothetical protein A2Y29_04425 [Spirochaetes bacterium GWE2_31_10]OHD51906.1 MAG: hypothetical protein A2015_00760 [Spirochaetes bacterium GWF1_31_7]HBD93782.1 transcriptional regulator [Spirochaetia bacterium]